MIDYEDWDKEPVSDDTFEINNHIVRVQRVYIGGDAWVTVSCDDCNCGNTIQEWDNKKDLNSNIHYFIGWFTNNPCTANTEYSRVSDEFDIESITENKIL